MLTVMVFLLGVYNLNAQVSGYSFAQSSGTYTAITGGTVAASSTVATTLDFASFSNLPIGFTFNYNGVNYTEFGVSPDGWIALGNATMSGSGTPLSSGAMNNVISAAGRDLFGRQFVTASTTSGSPNVTMTAGSLLGFSVGDALSGTGTAVGSVVASISSPTFTMDLNGVSTGTGRNIRAHNGVIRYEVIGTAPNRKLVIQWSKFSRWATSAPSDFLNFQIVLNETSNTINFVYDFPYVNAVGTFQVGLRGNSNADFNTRTTTTDWSTTNAGTGNTSSCSVSNTIFPISGLTYTWTPPTCITPSALNISNLTSTSATVNWTASVTNPSNGYDWELRTSGAAGSGATGLVNSGNVANTVLSAALSGLTAETTYTFHIRSNCGAGDLSAWASLPFFTGYCTPAPTSVDGTGITNVTMGGVNNTTAAETGNYGNYTAQVATAQQGLNLNINVTYSTGFTYNTFVWVDWNNDLDFLDAGEAYYLGESTNANPTTLSGTITIPITAALGNYRIRIGGADSGLGTTIPSNPCYTGAWGSFEDYTLNVIAPPPCVFPTALNTSNILAQSASLNWTASTSNPANGYEWEVRTSGAGGSGATGLVTSGTVAAGVVTANATGLSPLTNYTFYVRASCAGATFSDWVSGSFETPCLPPTVDTTTPGTRCGTGTVQLGATTAGTDLNWYANPTGGVSLGTGNTFTTPSIAATTSFYVSAGNVSAGNAILGAGATNSNFTAASFFPGGWGGTKTQYIIRASELIAAGVNAGPINSLGFEPTTSGQTYQGFFVRVGQTTETVSTTAFIDAGLTQVFAGTGTDNGFTPVANTVNTLAFSTPLTWDGTSNIVVSISWSRVPGASTAVGSTMKVDNVGFATSAYRQMDNVSPLVMQNELAATATGTSRPRFTINGNVICASPRTEVVATVTAPPAFSLSSPTATICQGQTSAPITIATGASDYNTYVWSPAAGVSGDEATGWSFNPTATSTFTLTASQSGGTLCAVTTTVVVTVNPVPSPIVITSPVEVCANDIQALTITGGTLDNVSILQENFNGATNNWTTANLSTGATPASVAWTLRPSPFTESFSNFSSNDATQFYLSNSDIGGSGNVTNASLISPAFSTLGFTQANLNFWHFYQHWASGNGQGNVQYSIDGGTTWVNIQSYTATTGTASGFVNANVSLPAAALNQSAVQIRYQHFVTWGYFWAIDNVSISGTQTTAITWAPVTNLFTDAAATTAYTGGAATTVYTKSATAGSQIYTITATTGIGCTATANVTVNTSVPLLPGTISGATTLCNAGTTTTLTTNGDAGGTWASSNTAFATVDASTGVVTAVATGSVDITYTHNNPAPCTTLTSAVHTIAVQVTPAPAGDTAQAFCGAANITQLVATGTDVKWYDAATGGNFLPTISAIGLTNGTTYYASQTLNGCESANRLAVTVTINPIPATPVITTAAATCSADGVATIANFNANATYTFTPAGPTVSAGVISGLTVGDSYTVTVTVNGCESIASQAFSVSGMLAVPAAPVVSTSVATCSANGTATITNYDSSLTYAFSPAGPTVDASGVISNLVCGTSYTVTASNINCTSAASASFEVGCQLATPAVAVISTTPATCSANGTATITNYDSSLTYAFDPAGPTVGANGVISNLVCGTSYTVTASNVNCSSVASASFTIGCILESPAVPTGDAVQNIEVPNAGDATLANIVVAGTGLIWYASEADALAGINPLPIGTVLVDGTTYYVVSSNGTCSSAPLAVTVNVTLGTAGFDNASFSYYPNPTVDVLNVNYTRNIESVSIVNMLGQEVKNLRPNANTFAIDMTNLQVGTYFMTVTSEEATHTVKVIKK